MEQDNIIDEFLGHVEDRLGIDIDLIVIRSEPAVSLALRLLTLAAVAGGLWTYAVGW